MSRGSRITVRHSSSSLFRTDLQYEMRVLESIIGLVRKMIGVGTGSIQADFRCTDPGYFSNFLIGIRVFNYYLFR